MACSGMRAGQPTVPEYRTAVDPRQAMRCTHTTALGDVVQHRDPLGRLPLGATQWSSLPLRTACCAGSAGAQAPRRLLPVGPTDTQVPSTALAMVPAGSMMTAKPRAIVHSWPSTYTIQPGNRLFSMAKIT